MPDNVPESGLSAVIESPRDSLWPICEVGPELYGHCCLLRLDPVASVAALEDQDAMCAASLVPRDWFLGINLSNDDNPLYDPDGQAYLGFNFCFVVSGLPEFEHASAPIAPSDHRAADCLPIFPISTLPWSDLHVPTQDYTAAVVSRLHYTRGQRVARLDPATLGKLCYSQRIDESSRCARTAEIQLVQKRSHQPETSSPAHDGQPDAVTKDDRGIPQHTLLGSLQDRLVGVRIFVEVWLDPATHPGPPADPAKFVEATSQVQEIWRSWQARVLQEAASHDTPADTAASAQEPARIVLAEEGIRPAETLLTMPVATGCTESTSPSGKEVGNIGQPRSHIHTVSSPHKQPLSLLRGALSTLRARFGRAQVRPMPEPK